FFSTAIPPACCVLGTQTVPNGARTAFPERPIVVLVAAFDLVGRCRGAPEEPRGKAQSVDHGRSMPWVVVEGIRVHAQRRVGGANSRGRRPMSAKSALATAGGMGAPGAATAGEGSLRPRPACTGSHSLRSRMGSS